MRKMFAVALLVTGLASQSLMAQGFSFYTGGRGGGFGISVNNGWYGRYPDYTRGYYGSGYYSPGWGNSYYRNHWPGHYHGGYNRGYYVPRNTYYYTPDYHYRGGRCW